MPENRLPVVTHDDRILFMVQKSDIGMVMDEGSEWWRQCRSGKQVAWYRPSDNGHAAIGDYRTEAEARQDGFRAECERYAVLAEGVTLTARGNELEVSSDLWKPTFERRYTVMAAGLRLAMRRGIVRYRGAYSRHSREAAEALRHRLKKYAVVKRYEHNLTLPADIGEKLLEELRPFCEQGGQWAGSQTGNIYLKGSLPTDKTNIKVHAYRMGTEYEALAGRVKVEVVLRKDALKSNGLRKVDQWPKQPEIQDRIAKVLRRQWKQVFSMAPKARAMLLEQTGTETEEQLFGFMLAAENTLGGVIRRVEALEREQARAAAEQARTAERLARLEAMHNGSGLRVVK